jgi:hypothetical protein
MQQLVCHCTHSYAVYVVHVVVLETVVAVPKLCVGVLFLYTVGTQSAR